MIPTLGDTPIPDLGIDKPIPTLGVDAIREGELTIEKIASAASAQEDFIRRITRPGPASL